MLRKVWFPVMIIVAIAEPSWAGGGDSSRGAAYANAMCASCHSVSADKATVSPVAGVVPLRDMKVGTPEELTKYFNTVHPNTSRILKNNQADDIVMFMQSLRQQP